jgi:hypothetical protein
MDQIEEIKEMLSSFDWHYEYSDDHNVWRKFSTKKALIMEKMRKIPLHTVAELLETVPEEFRGHWVLSLQKVEYAGHE